MSRPAAKIRSMDMPILDRVFAMDRGYVLDFTNRAFADFFRDELRVNIDHPRWTVQGTSKAKRLRHYLRQADGKTVLATLNALWEYRESSKMVNGYPELDDAVRAAFFRIIERFEGPPPHQVPPRGSVSPIAEGVASSLAACLLQVSDLGPQPRGYAFEKFLKQLFDAYGLSARASFRLVGEQIDGSFVSGGDVYLLEAKWANALVDAATLRSFNAKVEDKARWSRGLLLSYSGFSPEGLSAFGRGKSVICMDGRDLHGVLARRLDFAAVLAMKVRRAAETGQPFVRVDDLALLTRP